MKKLFLSLIMLLALNFFASAQNSSAAKHNSKAAPVKSDGSLDMRYKVNKDKKVAVPAGPTKADGTPDLRYKENKEKSKDKKKGSK